MVILLLPRAARLDEQTEKTPLLTGLLAVDPAVRVRRMAEPEGGVPADVLLGFPVHEYTAKSADPSTSKR